ncbi:hypothetical protein CAEBREN_02024 [Caenorhabditis brenneri]|uniref:Uncharacterized protein n=1 Tax=Caenorhabditis brenneri TaxID=135651 RepID=G0NYW7_CAEBE|nr:hypothetical protein CAEBREN_02024 [Caenorhabditis brenneri]
MPDDYPEFLRNKLSMERDLARIREHRQTHDRTSEFKSETEEELQRRIRDLEQKEKEEIESIQRKTDEKLRDIQNKTETEKAKYKQQIDEMKANGEKELKEKMKIYEGIISKNKEILRLEQLQVENDLLKEEKDLRQVNQKMEATFIEEQEKTDAKRGKLMNEQKERDEERLKEVMERKNQNLQTEIQTSSDVTTKSIEIQDKKNQDVEALAKANMKTQMSLFNTLQIDNHRYNNTVMNGLNEQLQTVFDEISNSYNQCKRYLRDGFVWNDQHKIRARDSFDGLRRLFNEARRRLTEMEERLCKLENNKVSKKMAKSINEMRLKLFALDGSTSTFRGLLLAGQTNWTEEEKNDLGKLMDEFVTIKFPYFDPLNRGLQAHIEASMPDVSESSEQGQIEQ